MTHKYVNARDIENQLNAVESWSRIAGRDARTAEIFASQAAILARMAKAYAQKINSLQS